MKHIIVVNVVKYVFAFKQLFIEPLQIYSGRRESGVFQITPWLSPNIFFFL